MAVQAFDDRNIVPYFHTISQHNESKSKEKGRPIFDEMEVVEIRFGGDMSNRPVFPAHDGVYMPDGQGGTEFVTYAERFSKQYQKFKEGKAQSKEGTPLEEAPFLNSKERSELKAMQILTVEQLASLDDRRLKSLGMFGRQKMDAAAAYIQSATGSADITRLAAENAELRALIQKLQQEDVEERVESAAETIEGQSESQFASWEVNDLKAYIEDETGSRPKGNPSKETLIKMAEDVRLESERK